MSTPIVITTAITGAVPRKRDNPAVPISPEEQIESTHEAYEAGSALVHIHVRNKDESSSSDPALFARVQEGVVKHCPGMITQFSTGGRGRRPRTHTGCARRQPHPQSRHGLAGHRLVQLPDRGLREPARLRGGPGANNV